jgi:hypothetical protein
MEDAIAVLPKRLVSMPVIMDGGTGLAFQMETAGQPKWTLILHRDVFFRVELRAFVGDSGKLTRRQGERLVKTGTADLFANSWGVCGSPVDIYLSRKLSDLRARHVHPLTPEGGLAASAQLRQICRQVWEETYPRDVAPRFLSEWGWRLGHFVRNYDKLLFKSVGAEQLETVLAGMGISLNSWALEVRLA